MSYRRRPIGITILALLAIPRSLMGLLPGLWLMGSSPFLGIVTVVMGILGFAFAYGAWKLEPWAWTLGVTLLVLGLLDPLYSMATGNSVEGQIINILISAAILFYLFDRNTRKLFERA